jgi:hypothetical protein
MQDICRIFNAGMASRQNNRKSSNGQKPNFPSHLFWDWDFDKIDWNKGYRSIIARILERGNKSQWEQLVEFYGKPRVIEALMKDIKYLPDYIMENVCSYFDLPKEALACYAHKQSRKGHWI